MKKYYFINFTIVMKNGAKLVHMSVLSTDKNFFPILEAKNKIKKVFDIEI